MADPTPPASDRAAAFDALLALHSDVDALVADVAALHRGRLRCGAGCADCCVDELTVLDIEAERIRRAHPDLLADGEPGPTGACAFLDSQRRCRIYDARPYVCRTQGLPLRWIDEAAPGEWVEYRDICPLNDDGPPIEGLDLHECWSIGIYEPRLLDLQEQWQGDAAQPRRVALRALFRSD